MIYLHFILHCIAYLIIMSFFFLHRVLHRSAWDSVSNPLPHRAKLPLLSIAGHVRKAGSAGKCTAWKTGTCGARSASGRKHAHDLWTEMHRLPRQPLSTILIFLSFLNNINKNELFLKNKKRSLLMPPTTMQLSAPINTKHWGIQDLWTQQIPFEYWLNMIGFWLDI